MLTLALCLLRHGPQRLLQGIDQQVDVLERERHGGTNPDEVVLGAGTAHQHATTCHLPRDPARYAGVGCASVSVGNHLEGLMKSFAANLA